MQLPLNYFLRTSSRFCTETKPTYFILSSLLFPALIFTHLSCMISSQVRAKRERGLANQHQKAQLRYLCSYACTDSVINALVILLYNVLQLFDLPA